MEDRDEESADSEDLVTEQAKTITASDIFHWHCVTHLDRLMVVGCFENKPSFQLKDYQQEAAEIAIRAGTNQDKITPRVKQSKFSESYKHRTELEEKINQLTENRKNYQDAPE